MACGPLLALPLSYLPKTALGPVNIDPITAGGWVMGLLWLLFLVLTLFFFAEPKSGLGSPSISCAGICNVSCLLNHASTMLWTTVKFLAWRLTRTRALCSNIQSAETYQNCCVGKRTVSIVCNTSQVLFDTRMLPPLPTSRGKWFQIPVVNNCFF